MVQRISAGLIVASLLAFSGCGAPQADEPAASEPSVRLEASIVADVDDGPEIGERIDDAPQSQRSVAQSDNSLVSAVRKEAERLDALEARGIREIGWEDLMPEGEEEKLAELYRQQMAMLYSGAPIVEGSAADAMIQIGTFNTVKELNETKVRIPGYTVPFEFGANAEVGEFLLVPYYGACLHAPPPPPNQTIFAMTDEPIKLRNLAQAVWIEGTIYTQTQESELADAAYTIQVDRVEIYEY